MITTKLHPALNTPLDNNVDGIQIDPGRLIADLVESSNPLVAIARDHKLRLDQLIAWAAQPAFRAILDAADELAQRIAAHKAIQGRPGAVETLNRQATGLWETPRDRVIANSAARTLVGISTPATAKTARTSVNDNPIRPPQPSEPIDPPLPSDHAADLPNHSFRTRTTESTNGHALRAAPPNPKPPPP